WAKTIPLALAWPALGTSLTEYGYGCTSGKGGSGNCSLATTLQKTPNGDIKRVDCGTLFGGYSGFSTGIVCAKGSNSMAWWGDSGGPLLWWINGYWQQGGDAMAISDTRTNAQHGQVYWSESDGSTRGWIEGLLGVHPAAGTLVRDASSGTAWLY